MILASEWVQSQQNLITFPLLDSSGVEVAGLSTAFTVQLSKGTGAFAASAGTKGEKGLGWYWYLATADEADTIGPVSVVVTHASTIQQNLEYVVESRATIAEEFEYTLTDSTTNDPIEGADIWICTDAAGTKVIWQGVTGADGIAVDDNGSLPRIDPGTVYIFRRKTGYQFVDPDTEVIT